MRKSETSYFGDLQTSIAGADNEVRQTISAGGLSIGPSDEGEVDTDFPKNLVVGLEHGRPCRSHHEQSIQYGVVQ